MTFSIKLQKAKEMFSFVFEWIVAITFMKVN